MRLIDEEKLPLEPKEANQFIPYEYASGWNDMLLNVLKAEQIDAVPVVRCRECKNYVIVDEFEGGKRYMCLVNHFSYLDNDGDNQFCSYGERKEGTKND